MKTWEIKLKVPDEKTALEYLEMLVKGFKASIKVEQDMDFFHVDNSKKKEKMTCVLIKK